MMDVVDDKPTPILILSKSCMAIVVLLAIIWEELISSWSSKIVFKILLYTVAALVYLHYARMATSERINIPEAACEIDDGEFILPNMSDEPYNSDVGSESHDLLGVTSESSDSQLDYTSSPVPQRTSVTPVKKGVSRKLIQTMISTPPYKGHRSYMDGGSRMAVFIIDSGASHHVVNDVSILDNIIHKGPHENLGRVQGCVSDSGVQIKGYGNIPMIGRTLYAPGIVANVLSVSQLNKDGFVITFSKGRCTATRIVNHEQDEITGIIYNNNYVAEIPVIGVLPGIPGSARSSDREFSATCFMLSAELEHGSGEASDKAISRNNIILHDPVSA